MHAGAWPNNCSLGDIQLALEKRYGPSTNVEEFVSKAQLAHYENVRAQFESFAACGWASHKMTVYWMLNSHWPSFYGNLTQGTPVLSHIHKERMFVEYELNHKQLLGYYCKNIKTSWHIIKALFKAGY